MTSDTERLPILIVGAGPVGLTMALALSIGGIKSRIIDKAPARSEKSKALGIHARTLELLESLGVIDDFLKIGQIVHATSVYIGKKKLMHMSLDEIPSPYPFALMVPQNETERLLAEELEKRDILIERELEVTTFVQNDDFVTTTVKNVDGSVQTIESNWILGCDGAHSAVRHTLGLKFEGSTYDESFATADCLVDWENPDDELSGFVSEDGILFFFPMGDRRYRVIADGPMHKPTDVLSLEEMQQLVNKRAGRDVPLSNATWLTWFTINRRGVQHYRVGRAFVSGDAAHVHSPVMGQGMNTGMQDALNLAWKLELVEKGMASADLLQTYEAERHPIGQTLLKNTDVMTKLVTIRNPISQQIRNHLMPIIANAEVIHERALKILSMVGLNYRSSRIVGEHREKIEKSLSHPIEDVPAWLDFSHGPNPGDRAPDGDLKTSNESESSRLFEQFRGFTHNIVVFAGLHDTSHTAQEIMAVVEQLQDRYASFAHVHLIVSKENLSGFSSMQDTALVDEFKTLHHQYGAAHSCLYLVRPDGYVGYRCQPINVDRLQNFLESTYGFQPISEHAAASFAN